MGNSLFVRRIAILSVRTHFVQMDRFLEILREKWITPVDNV